MNLLFRAYANAPLLLVLASLGWAGNAIAGRLAAGEVSPMLLIFLRWGLIAAALTAVEFRRIRAAIPLMRARRRWTLFMGASILLFDGFFYWAANFTTAINIGIFQGTVPAMIILGMFLVFGARVNRHQLIGLLLTLAGAALVVSEGSAAALLGLSFNPGDLLMLAGCLCYVGHTMGLQSRPPINAFVMMWFIAVAAFLTAAPLAAAEWYLGYTLAPAADDWLLLLYIVVVPSFLSQVFFMRGVDLIGAARAGMCINLVPIFAALLGVILLSESPRLYHFAAIILVFGGIYLFEKRRAAVQ